MLLKIEMAEILGQIVEATSRSAGPEFFQALSASLAKALGVRYCMLTECIDSPPTRVRTLAFAVNGELAPNFEYDLLATPCERVMLGQNCVFGEGVQQIFPDDGDLVTLAAESYAAVPLLDAADRVIGHLVVMDTEPFERDFLGIALLRVFATRAAAEIERDRATAKLVRSEARLRQVIDLVPHFIFAKDRDGRFILANRAVADAYGTTTEALHGKTDGDFSPSQEDIKRFRHDDLEVIETGRTKVVEETIRDASGRQRILQTTKIPFTSSTHSTPSVLGVAVDITEQRQLEKQRKQLEAQVLHVQKLESLGVLAGGLAHDFNNLLTSVLGNVELAMQSISATTAARGHLQEIKLAAKRSAELVAQMLAYSGRGAFEISNIDLNLLIEEMSGLLKTSISKKVRLESDLQPRLPRIHGDATQIRQVVMNLITNASESLSEKPGTVCVRTCAHEVDRAYLESSFLAYDAEPGPFVMLEVKDDGCGMDAQTLDRLFDPFFTTKVTGRGLGLAALLGIVRSHGGAIRVDSDVGKGSVFTILLPAAHAAQEDVATHSTRSVAAHQGATVLLVDDEEMVRKVTSQLLARADFEVIIAVDGRHAVDIFSQRHSEIDITLLDMMMPRLNGLETLAELRRIDPDVKVLLSSGYSEQILSHLDSDDSVGFLKKPYRPADMVQKLRDLLSTTAES